jgi:hypothetical protein
MPELSRVLARRGVANRRYFACGLCLHLHPDRRLLGQSAAKDEPVAAAGNFKEERLVDAG